MLKVLYIIFGVALIMCIGTCLYFVAGVSATLPPIKQYDYEKNFNQFKSGMNEVVAANKNISYEITDTTGDAKTGYRFYISVFIKEEKRTLEYHVYYDKTDFLFKKNKTQLCLIFAYDQTHRLGGYGIKAFGIDNLIRVFEQKVMYAILR